MSPRKRPARHHQIIFIQKVQYPESESIVGSLAKTVSQTEIGNSIRFNIISRIIVNTCKNSAVEQQLIICRKTLIAIGNCTGHFMEGNINQLVTGGFILRNGVSITSADANLIVPEFFIVAKQYLSAVRLHTIEILRRPFFSNSGNPLDHVPDFYQ